MPKGKIKILIVDDIPEARENLKKLLAFEPDFEIVGTASTGREGIDQAKATMPDVILMDINMPDMDGITATKELRRLVPSAGVVMMSVQSEAEYLRRSMAAGARDFLTKPPPADELYATIRNVAETMESIPVAPPPGSYAPAATGGRGPVTRDRDRDTKVVVIYSPQGGAGKTTVATNMAAALMTEGTKVLLMDYALQFGDVGVFLNLQTQNSIVDLMSMDDLDMDLVESVVATHDSGLKVLLAPPRTEQAEMVSTDRARGLVDKLKGVFDFIVIDLSSTLNDLALEMFDAADRIVLVSNATLPTVTKTLNVMKIFDDLGYPEEKVQLVLNRITPDLERAKVAVAVSVIEAKLKRKPLAIIPMDERKVLYAVNRGIAVVSKDQTVPPAKDLISLADAIRTSFGVQEEEPAPPPTAQKTSRLGRLFGGG
jgi:pilus assembly protein CpaE